MADAIAAQYGFVNGTDSVTVTVNNPPQSGGYTTNTGAYEVIVQQPPGLLIAASYLSSVNISARAVAAQGAPGNGCVLALDKGDIVDLTDTGNADLEIQHCDVYVNSSDPNGALTMTGSSTINAWSAFIVGGTRISGGAALNTTHGTFTGATPINDPYAGTPVPSVGSCAGGYSTYPNINSTVNLSPGTYCGGLNVQSQATVNLSPGTNIMNAGAFSIAGGATINGTGGVTIILTGSGSNYATVDIEGGANVNIVAPTSGTYAGLAFFQDPSAPVGANNKFTGGSTQNITGAIYFPNQLASFSGNSATGGPTCTQLVALEIKITGTTNFSSNCTSAGTKSIGATATQLVE